MSRLVCVYICHYIEGKNNIKKAKRQNEIRHKANM